MNIPKVISFANSHKSFTQFPSQPSPEIGFPQVNANHSPQNSNFSIPQLKQQMLEVITQLRNKQVFEKIHKKYSTPVSLMQSGVSIPKEQSTEINLPLGVLKLEVSVTEQILALREDKLTLLDEYNKTIEMRLKTERDLKKLNKKMNKQNAEVTEITVFQSEKKQKARISHFSVEQDYSEQNSSSRENKDKSRRISLLTQKQKEEDDIVSEIEKLQQSSRMIQNRILERLSGLKSSNQPSNHFEFERTSQTIFNLLQQRSQLREQRDSLHVELANQVTNKSMGAELWHLVMQNKQLREANDQSVRRDHTILTDLREQVRKQKVQKKAFFQQIALFKSKFNEMRKENLNLHSQINRNKLKR